jgi:hypothetical protein
MQLLDRHTHVKKLLINTELLNPCCGIERCLNKTEELVEGDDGELNVSVHLSFTNTRFVRVTTLPHYIGYQCFA